MKVASLPSLPADVAVCDLERHYSDVKKRLYRENRQAVAAPSLEIFPDILSTKPEETEIPQAQALQPPENCGALHEACSPAFADPPQVVANRRMIVDAVAYRFGVTVANLFGPDQRHTFVVPRHIAMYLIKRMLKHSLPRIADYFGGRDHTTVMNGVRRYAAARLVDAPIAAELHNLEHAITHRIPIERMS